MKSNAILYRLAVATPTLTYPVYIGERMQDMYKDFFEGYPAIAVITNDAIFSLHNSVLSAIRKEFPQAFHVVISDGEDYKSIETLREIYQKLIAERVGRDGLVVGFGGGVIGDLAGFASATYMRGIDYLQIPTTLLAMVDSGIGGKTAINLPEGKNLVGAYHQPQAVLCDLHLLDTLPAREFQAGLMEVIKYGMILDASFYRYMVQNKEDIVARKRDTVAYLIYRSCQLKAEIVAQDEKEKGIRGILNFGHTIAHALESYTNYRVYLHGEAVSIGSLIIIHYLVEKGILECRILEEFTGLLSFFQLPCSLPVDFDIERIVEYVAYDKKNRNGRIRWVTLKQIGVPAWEQDLDLDQIKKILKKLKEN